MLVLFCSALLLQLIVTAKSDALCIYGLQADRLYRFYKSYKFYKFHKFSSTTGLVCQARRPIFLVTDSQVLKIYTTYEIVGVAKIADPQVSHAVQQGICKNYKYRMSSSRRSGRLCVITRRTNPFNIRLPETSYHNTVVYEDLCPNYNQL